MENIIDNDTLDIIFNDINNSIDNEYIIYSYINILKNEIFNIDYNNLISNIIKYLDNQSFVINFLNKFIADIPSHSVIIQNDIISSDIDMNKIKNFLLIDNLDNNIYFVIYLIKNILVNELYDLTNYIYLIGKIDKLITSLTNYIYNNTKILKINNVLTTINILMKFLFDDNNNFDNEIYVKILKFILNITNDYLFTYFETINIINLVFITYNDQLDISFINRLNNQDSINLYLNFYLNALNNIDKYYNINIVSYCINYIINILQINNNQTNFICRDIIIKLSDLLSKYNDIINIHDRLNIYLDVSKLIIKINESDYIPNNLIDNILKFYKDVNFFDWITVNECLDIFNTTTKLLLLINNSNKLYNTRCDEILFILIKYEGFLLKMTENYINKNIYNFTYESIKNIILDLINIIYILTYIQRRYIDYLNNNYLFNQYSDVVYKLNMELNNYLFVILNNNNIYKFNVDILFKNIITLKISNLYNQIKLKKYVNINIEYDKLIDYYNKYNYIIDNNFIDVINNLKNKSDGDNILLDKYDDTIFVDKLFCNIINVPYMLPNNNDFYDRDLIRLVIRETNKNPLTREDITLEELDNYNNSDNIRIKLNQFISEKNKLFIHNI